MILTLGQFIKIGRWSHLVRHEDRRGNEFRSFAEALIPFILEAIPDAKSVDLLPRGSWSNSGGIPRENGGKIFDSAGKYLGKVNVSFFVRFPEPGVLYDAIHKEFYNLKPDSDLLLSICFSLYHASKQHMDAVEKLFDTKYGSDFNNILLAYKSSASDDMQL